MVTYPQTTFKGLCIHKVGNRSLDETLKLSEKPALIFDEHLEQLLRTYFLSPFEKTNALYRLDHPTGDLELNTVYHLCSKIFDKPQELLPLSKQLAQHLYDLADHPKIKSGEVYFTYFENLQVEGEEHDAIGIFKSESKEAFLKISIDGKDLGLEYEEEGINIKKLDKGCIIFNTEKSEGYKVLVTDQANRAEAIYWIDDFLKLKIRNDEYHQTENILGIYKDFVTGKMNEEFDISAPDKIDLLNRSINYFKEKENFDMDEFAREVISDEHGIRSFKAFKKNFEEESDTEISDEFSINKAAVKKQARNFKSVLKLDKNFHIYIHGNREYIEKGYDEGKKLSYYKVYFREEN